MAKKLTETLLKGLTPPARGELYTYDTEVTGFAVKLFAATKANPKGARTFVLVIAATGACAASASGAGRSGRSPPPAPRRRRSGNGSTVARIRPTSGESGARR